MKKILLTIIGGLLFSFLFYYQQLGINTLLYSIIILSIIFIDNPQKLTDKKVLLHSALLLIAALGIVISSQNLSIITYCITFPIFITLIFHSALSKPIALIIGTGNLISSWLFPFTKSNINNSKPLLIARKIIPLSIALFVSFVFYLLYSSADPVVSWLQQQVDLSVINYGLIFTTILGMIVTYGALHHNFGQHLIQEDLLFNKKTFVKSIKRGTLKQLFTFKMIAQYTLIAVISLLTFVNLIDIATLLSNTTPEGITPSQYLHDGFYSLVFSIVLAIFLVLIFFGGSLNFIRQRRKLAQIAKIWLVLNIIIVLATSYKIGNYIFNFGLTYNRILISVFLISVTIGLFISWIKINNTFNNRYVLRVAFSSAIFVLLGISTIPWNSVITTYNLSKEFEHIDPLYLIDLKNNGNKLSQYTETDQSLFSDDQVIEIKNKLELENKLFFELSWKSWNYVQSANMKSH